MIGVEMLFARLLCGNVRYFAVALSGANTFVVFYWALLNITPFFRDMSQTARKLGRKVSEE
jgi:hypothetical protein